MCPYSMCLFNTFYFLTLLALCSPLASAAPDLSGEWEFAAKNFNDTNYARLKFKTEGEKLTGSLNELKLEGAIKGDEFSFTAKRPNAEHFGDFTGKATG